MPLSNARTQIPDPLAHPFSILFNCKIRMRLIAESSPILARGVRCLVETWSFPGCWMFDVGCFHYPRFRQQLLSFHPFLKLLRQKSLVRRVLQQPSHEVCHSWQQFADGT